ncbi:MAG TPA: GAF domain-containing protein [Mycobacterium sp.]
MTKPLPGFDDSLNRALEECARDAGEDVDTYIARAVGAQMVADLIRAEKPASKDLLEHLSQAGVFATDAMPDVSDAVRNPARLRALYATGLMDSPPEEKYDRITRAAADALDAPFAAVSLIDVDRQFFKSTVGMEGMAPDERQTPLDQSVCQYSVANGTPLILEDARTDPIYKNHPVVQAGAVIAYLGIPLIDHEGNAIGTLCVFDNKPRLWGTGHVQIMTDLAQIVSERVFGSDAAPNN